MPTEGFSKNESDITEPGQKYRGSITESERNEAIEGKIDFNNLFMKLPGGPARSIYLAPNQAKNIMNIMYPNKPDSNISLRSNRAKITTNEQFYELFDLILKKLSVKKENRIDEIEELIRIRCERGKKIPNIIDLRKAQTELNKILRYVYVELRSLDFDWYDLCG